MAQIDRELYARTFLQSGEAYERYRPGFPAEALELILPDRVGAVLDLGAGTGKLTRMLVDRAARVIAVDPSASMLAELHRVSPTVDVRVGTAEAIPLDDASIDTVTVAQAFHWFDRDRAIVELRRVLRPGGALALLWNVPDADCAWDIACGRIAHPERGDEFPDQTVPPVREPMEGFVQTESTWIRWVEPLPRADYLARWQTVSAMMLADDAERAERIGRMEQILDADPQTAGRDILPLRQATSVFVYRVAD